MNKHLKKWVLTFSVFAIGLVITFYLSAPKATSQVNEPAEITGAITDQEAAQACFVLLERNLQAATEKDIDAYTDTLVLHAEEETKAEMIPFFDEYTLAHTLLSFEVIKQEANTMLVAAQQKTINLGENNYRNHITQAHHTFIKEGAEWKIQQTVMTNTEFLD
ncbi:hypothetical protein [Enterococcus sp. DIV0876]|uniref:hypothetical protein n=1 Tax=Enterococcus sp. DIV0876 TaxID=2774633 RepID=UPI003D301023